MTIGDLVFFSVYANIEINRAQALFNKLQEVCCAHSTPTFQSEEGVKLTPLNPHYLTGFIDGEGCFSVKKHLTLKGIQKFAKIQQRMREIGKKDVNNR